MEQKSLHQSGPVLSRIIAGAWRWNLPVNNVDRLIRTSLDLGITTFDHADIYGDHENEQTFGNALRLDPSLRRRMEIVTKCGIKFPSSRRPASWVKHYDTSAKHIAWSVDNSLQNFGTDYIDLLLIHRPDPLLNPGEVAEAFAALKASGKVLHFGVSNFTSTQFEVLQSYMSQPLVTNQLEISLAHHSSMFDGSLDVLMKHRVSPMAWSPLGGGRLMDGSSDQVFAKADRYGASKVQFALAWLLKHPSGIFPVIGTTQPERISESAKAVDFEIDVQDWFEMLKIVQGNEMP
ncbi:MAG: aldo/keto reductase [Chryseolinea sp.]